MVRKHILPQHPTHTRAPRARVVHESEANISAKKYRNPNARTVVGQKKEQTKKAGKENPKLDLTGIGR